MRRRSKRARQDSFIRRYGHSYPRFQELAALAESYIRSCLEDMRFDLHLITARAKSPASIQEKIVRKAYGNPARQLKDVIGVRVITYYAEDVDRVAEKLRRKLDIDEANSVDKRHALAVREFGYRSVQLVARPGKRGFDRFKFGLLRGVWFEVQIRSILEHAWSEIEHEVVYKSAIKYSDSVLRRFASLAGGLEILEREFLALKKERSGLIDHHRRTYERRKERRLPFDSARLLGFLEALHPEGLSWREAERLGRPFPPKIEATCMRALRDVGLNTPERLERFMNRVRFRGQLAAFAGSQGIPIQTVSHLALVQIAVGLRDKAAFVAHFPDFQPVQLAFPLN